MKEPVPGRRIFVAARLMLRSLGPDWSQGHLDKAHKRPGMEPREPSYTFQTKPLQMDGVTMAVLGIGALAALKGYLWVQDGEIWKAALLGAGTALGLAAGGWAWWRWKKARSRVEDPILIQEKVSRIAFDAEVQVTAILPAGTRPQRAGELLGPVAAAYRHYDNPAGARFKVSHVRPVLPDPEMLHPAGPGLFGGRSVLGVREVACLWHPPGAGDETPLVERSGARTLSPSAKGVRGGALVGDTTAGKPRPIRFPEDLLRRHHLYVARTRMGKSTLMHHLVTHKMREKAEGRDGDAIVVVDPHTDLVAGLMEHVPESLIDRVRLIDLSDETRSPGINLLDTRVFADRDRTADSVVRVAKGLWEQWGPRMQSILEQTVKTLHEANEQVEAERQYTILDGLRLLSNDPYLLEWWARDFGSWHRQYKAEALAPVQTRLSYYASSKRARAILGQRRSTIDLRRTIHDGGVLLVYTSLLNLVDAVIREQGRLTLHRRRGALVVVDEMQSMPGVDYESMLSELGKYGASFVLATQSLAKLDDLSPTMRDTLLANVGCLAVFQVAGNDARTLVWELGKDRVTEDDITSLPVHHCYVRATVGIDRMDAFSMKVRKPEPGEPERAARIRADAEGYLTAARDIAERDAGERDLVEKYRRELENLRNGQNAASQDTARRRQRSSGSGTAKRPPRIRRKGKPRTERRRTRSVRNDAAHRGQGGTAPAPRRHALPRPAGDGRRLRLVQGRGLRGRQMAGGRGAGRLRPPRHRPGSPHSQVPPHRRRPAPPGPGRGHDPGRPASQPSRIGTLAARPPGAPRRPGRRLPPGVGRRQPVPPHPLPLVPRHADGRRPSPPRWAHGR